MRVLDRRAALAADVDVRHPGIERTRADERVHGDEVVEAVAAHRAQLVRREAGLELEDAARAAGREHLVHGRVLEADLLPVHADPVPLRHVPRGVVDHGQRAQAQEVHLEHARLLERVHVELRDHRAALRVRADRHVVVQRPRRDHDARRVHGTVARESLDAFRVVEELLHLGVVAVALREFPHLLPRLRHREREARRRGHELREAIRVRRGEAKHAAHVADHGARLHRPEGDDLPDRGLSVLLPHVVDDLAAALVAEVDVDVRHRDAFRIQEALEEEVELERVHVGDAERVADDRPRRRPAAGPDRDVPFARGDDEVPDDEQVSRVPRVPDDPEFVVEALAHRVGQGIAVLRLRPLRRLVAQHLHGVGEAVREREIGQLVLLLERDVAALGDLHRLGEEAGQVREEFRHLFGGLEVALLPVEAEPVGVVLVLARPDAEERVVRVRVLAPHVVRVVRHHEREAEFLGDLDDPPVHDVLLRDPVVLEFEPVPVAEHARVPLRRPLRVVVALVLQVARDLAGEAGGEADDPVRIFFKHLAVHAGAAVEALRVPDGREPDEVRVPARVLREQHEVRVVGRGALLELAGAAVAVGDVGLAADDRLDPLCAGLLLELPRAVEVAVVGEGEGRHVEFDRAVYEVVDAVRAVEERVLAMCVKMNERHPGDPVRPSLSELAAGFGYAPDPTQRNDPSISCNCSMYSYLGRFGE